MIAGEPGEVMVNVPGTPAVKVTLFPLVICGAAAICAKIAKVCAKIAKPVVASTRAKEVAMRCTVQHGAVTVGQREQKSAQQQAKLAAPVAGASGMTVTNSTLSGNSAVLADGGGGRRPDKRSTRFFSDCFIVVRFAQRR